MVMELWPPRAPDPRALNPALASGCQLVLLWHSDLWSFLERRIVKAGAEGRTGAVNRLGEGKIIHIPHSADTHTHTFSEKHTLDSSRRENVAREDTGNTLRMKSNTSLIQRARLVVAIEPESLLISWVPIGQLSAH